VAVTTTLEPHDYFCLLIDIHECVHASPPYIQGAADSLPKGCGFVRRYVYNKIDVCSIEEVDAIARMNYSIPVSAFQELNMDGLLERMWDMMALVRVYTKKARSQLWCICMRACVSALLCVYPLCLCLHPYCQRRRFLCMYISNLS
jgi:hypothetical protein